jgi:hypothetical protein
MIGYKREGARIVLFVSALLVLGWGVLRVSRVAAAPLAASGGPNFAGTATGKGWNLLSNATGSNDNQCASAAAPHQNIDLTNFSFSIPTGSPITGILIEPKATSGSASHDFSATLLKAGSPVGTAKTWVPAAGLCSASAFASLGGDGDTWGASWTSNDINAANFGVRINNGTGGLSGAGIDAVKITVFTSGPAEVPEADTLLLFGGGMCGLVTWIGWQWRKGRVKKG